jgi:radical SAM protein with 4Fe4S-binding SPASM domain
MSTAAGAAAPSGAAALANPLRLDRPLKATISYTHSCNLDCRVCYAGCTREPSPREIPGETWKALLDRMMDDGVISLMFEGGEPLHRPDFLDVLAHGARRAMTKLRTNGTLVDAVLAAELRRIGCGEALVDVLGARPETHDWLTGAPGSHARCLDGVRALRGAGIPTTILTIMNRRNIGELQEVLELAQGLGVGTVSILRPYPLGRMRERWDELSLSLDEMMLALAALRPPEGVRVTQSWHPNDANCCWQMAAVNAYGDSIGCAYLREYVNFGNLLQTPLAGTWDHPLYRELRSGRVEKSCPECSAGQRSHGGCRATAFAFHRRWSAPDPFDIGLNEGVDLRVLPAETSAPDSRPAAAPGAGAGDVHRVHPGDAAALHAQPQRMADPGTGAGTDARGARDSL